MKKSISVVTIVSLFSSILLPTVVIAEDSELKVSNGKESTIISEETKDVAGESSENNEKTEFVDNVETDLSKSNQDNVAINSDQNIVENESLSKEEKETTPAPISLNDNDTNTESTVADKTVKKSTPENAFTVSGGVITGYDATLGGTDVVIPDSINGIPITTIADSAFSNKGLTSVTFPNTVTRINRLAFDNNPALSNVQLPSNLTTIGMGAFRECGLTNVVIPDSVTTLDSYAFYWNKLTDVTIGSGVSYISTFAFANNPLVNVNLGNVTRIGAQAFTGTTINELVVPATVQRIERQAFENANINKLVLTEGLSYIGEAAFRNSMFQTLELPNSVTTIEKRAFVDGKLTTVKIGTSLKTINSSTFASNQISTIDFSNVETIGEQAFIGNNLGELTLPNALTTIGNSAFSNSNIHTIHWGNSIKSIGSSAFSSNQIKKLTVTAEKIGYASFGRNPLEEVTLADSVKAVEANAFMGDNNNPTLKKIDLGQGVESIGNTAFSNGLVESLQLPASLKTVGSGAFGYQQLPFIELNATNPRVSYGYQRLQPKSLRKDIDAKKVTVNLSELYPGIDPAKVKVTQVKYGVSTSGSAFVYEPTTGLLTFDGGGSTYSTIYYDYVIDNKTVLSVEQKLQYSNRYTATWKDWDGSLIQEDTFEEPYGVDIIATPQANPKRNGYTFSSWNRNPSTGQGNPFLITTNTEFTAVYVENWYKIIFDLNYEGATNPQFPTSVRWEQANIANYIPKRTGYDFLGWEYNGQLVTSTDTVATLLNNVDPGDGAEITFTARWAKKKVYMTVPDTIDFGSQKLIKGTQYYKATVQGDPLAVYDERGRGSKWQVTAKLTNELTNTSTNKKLENALIYKEYSTEKILSSNAAQIIKSYTTSKDSEVTKISDSWTEQQGLLLKVEQGKASIGEYTGTIEWTLNDTP
ncbi:leucine-rich repeat domain-containing protein [Enterococcus faecalis]|nr:leucine-rich repeat protein [Enterococcus faecalis]EIP8252421.1 leucine-rich repeat domain-containing protein [Enterococcus faecalis]EKD5186485.1 leucine-rich repeat domain-containing protein [Enterococcus faecalis]EKI8842748.1 leucine-rich repeat domain-containing protein [Enterococcus faecalis]ELS0386871.1 leucine-rich repeat domain-containing protein [Enterococcus faecalis]